MAEYEIGTMTIGELSRLRIVIAMMTHYAVTHGLASRWPRRRKHASVRT